MNQYLVDDYKYNNEQIINYSHMFKLQVLYRMF